MMSFEDFGFGVAALVKFLMSVFGVGPEASTQAAQDHRTHTFTTVYSTVESESLVETAEIVRHRLRLLKVEDSEVMVTGSALSVSKLLLYIRSGPLPTRLSLLELR